MKLATRLTPLALALAVAGAPMAPAAEAANSFSLEGGATATSNGIVLESDADDAFSNIVFDVPQDTTFAEIGQLSVTFTATEGGCGGGSPRFAIPVDTDNDGDFDGNIHVNLGDLPNFTCAEGQTVNVGNLIGSTEARFDLTQLGGPFYGTYQQALSLFGNDEIGDIRFIVDAGWKFPGGQVITVTRLNVDGHQLQVGPAKANACKKGGWQTMIDPRTGDTFRNQGQCVSYFNKNKNKNQNGDDDIVQKDKKQKGNNKNKNKHS